MTGGKQKRVALIIGNARYRHASRLKNPKNDAKALGYAFRRLGFRIITPRFNLDYNAFRLALQKFALEADDADMAVVYFAGHGIEVNKQSFLIPTDAMLERWQDVQYETITLDQVLTSVYSARLLKLVILDACRDNPFRARLRSGGRGSIAIGKGLSEIDPGNDILVAYAAEHGKIAYDGQGKNSPYVEALLSHIEKPGIEIAQLFREVRDDVQKRTGWKQTPFTYGSLGREQIYFIPPKSDPTLIDPRPEPPRVPLWQKAAAAAGLATAIVALVISLRLDPDSGDTKVELSDPQKDRISDLKIRAGQQGQDAEGAADELGRLGFVLVTARSGNAVRTHWIKAGGGKDPGDSFQDCWGRQTDQKLCGPRMVVVPAAIPFQMGSPENEAMRNPDEDDTAGRDGKRVRVTFNAPFAVGKFEISFAQWSLCLSEGGCAINPRLNGEKDDQPVVNVSWTDITGQYLPWLNTKVSGDRDRPYRLLSEAEWEYAARAGTSSPYWFGESIGEGQVSLGGRRTMPVNRLAANEWGLHHVHGNVWEWVQNCYLDSYKDVKSDGTNGTSAQEVCQGARVARGGSFTNGPADVRSAKRLAVAAHLQSGDIGFRVARSLEPRLQALDRPTALATPLKQPN